MLPSRFTFPSRRRLAKVIAASAFSLLIVAPALGAAGESPAKKVLKRASSGLALIEIVAGQSIGGVALGASIASLPRGATVRALDGTYRGVSFTHAHGRIDDVWIDDLRKMRLPVRWAGKDIPPHAKLSTLKDLFGPCQAVEGLKGGMAFRCDSGITLGCDFHGQGTFVQIRFQPDGQ